MPRNLSLLWLGILASAACAPVERIGDTVHALSASRDPNESFGAAVHRNLPTYDSKSDGPDAPQVVNRKVGLANIDLSRVPVWDADTLAVDFARVRDTRFMEQTQRPHFPRRPSFLYPDDGCFDRAEIMAHELEADGRPAKVFSFGSLQVKTSNSPAGSVSWWYHVAPLVVVDGTPMVIDPSIEPTMPIALEAWIARQGSTQEVTVSVCSSYAYNPDDLCDQTTDQYETALHDQDRYLTAEWSRQLELGRDPNAVLGDAPPWVTQPPSSDAGQP